MADANLETLQPMVQRLLEGQRSAETELDRIGDDLGDLKLRTTRTEEALAGVNRRLDRLDARVDASSAGWTYSGGVTPNPVSRRIPRDNPSRHGIGGGRCKRSNH